MLRMIGPAAVMLAALSAACGEADAVREGEGVSERDSAGVAIIENGRPDPSRTLLEDSVPILQVGVIDGPPQYQFFRISDVKRLSDGGLAVANAGSRELLIYDADGTHRATVGGAGEGPTEFRYPRALRVLPGDTIQVQDFMDRVFFAPDGTFLRRERTDMQALMAVWERAGGQSEGGQWTADGSLLAPIYHWDREPAPPTPGPLRRPAMTLVRVSPDLTAIDTLGDYGGILQQYVDMGGARGVSSIVPPFATQTSWSIGAADGTVVVGDAASPEVHRFHPDGARSIIRWVEDPTPITDADVEAWKDRQREAEWVRGQLPALERGWAAMDTPEARAHYGRITAGSDGMVWVGPVDAAGEPTIYRAFDARGHYRGRVEIPGLFSAHDSGPGWLVGVLRGSGDVEYVRMYELRAPEPRG